MKKSDCARLLKKYIEESKFKKLKKLLHYFKIPKLREILEHYRLLSKQGHYTYLYQYDKAVGIIKTELQERITKSIDFILSEN